MARNVGIKRLTALVAAGVLAVPVLGACAPEPAPAPAPEPTETAAAAPLFDMLPTKYQDAGKLIFVHSNRPPYDVITEGGGTITGLNSEIEARFLEMLGVEAEPIILAGLPEALTALNSSRADIWLGPIDATPERQEEFDMVWWVQSRASFVISKTGEYADAESSLDLCGATISFLNGSRTELFIDAFSETCVGEGLPPAEKIALNDTPASLLALQAGRIDAMGTTQATAVDTVNRAGDEYTYVNIAEDGSDEFTTKLAVVVTKESGLGPVVLEIFESMFADGTYTRLLDEYGLGDLSVDKPVLNP